MMQMKTMKGQVTIVNLLGVVITLIIYSVLLPVLQPFIDDIVTYETVHSNPFSTAIIGIAYMLPFLLLLVIVVTAINYATPQREGVMPYG
jgi:hypothetical protein